MVRSRTVPEGAPVDRAARDKAIELVLEFYSGQRTDHELVDELGEIRSADPVISAIREQLWWVAEGLRPTHRKREMLPKRVTSAIDQCMVFLRSNLEHEDLAEGSGSDCWPFANRQQLEDELERQLKAENAGQ